MCFCRRWRGRSALDDAFYCIYIKCRTRRLDLNRTSAKRSGICVFTAFRLRRQNISTLIRPSQYREANMTAKKSVTRASAKSGGKRASSSTRGVREESASSAFAMPPLKSGARTSKRKVIDPDNPPLTAEQLKSMRPLNEEEKAFWRKALGRPPLESPKQAVSLRLDQDVIAHYKKSGPGWQSRMNEALRKQAKLKGGVASHSKTSTDRACNCSGDRGQAHHHKGRDYERQTKRK